MKRIVWACGALAMLAACGGSALQPAAAPGRVTLGGVVAQPGPHPCPACVLTLHPSTSDLYDLSGSIDGDYFSQQGVSHIDNATMHLYDEDDIELASAAASPSRATGAASMSGSIRGIDAVSATLTWSVTFTNNTTGSVSQDVPLQ